MLLRRLKLVNYGGIYNGMGLYEINIDFTKCKNKIILIRGDNGSGKTTIDGTLKPLPDENSDFIEGLTAIKEIDYFDETTNCVYALSFIHECNSKGVRQTAKGYFKKINYSTGDITELNPSGNITQCKDIIYDEFQLDPNYIALTQLSSGNRGLADRRPADRKKFVNNLSGSTEVYNAIFKQLSKKSSVYKNMMNSIASKINSIGNVAKLNDELNSLNQKIDVIQRANTKAIKEKSSAEGSLREIDPDPQATQKIIESESRLNELKREYNTINNTLNKVINTLYSSYSHNNNFSLPEFDESNIESVLSSVEYDHNALIKNVQNIRSNIEELLSKLNTESAELQTRSEKLHSIMQGTNLEESKRMLNRINQEMLIIEEHMKDYVVDINSISEDELRMNVNLYKGIKSELEECLRLYGSDIFETVMKMEPPKYIGGSEEDIINEMESIVQEDKVCEELEKQVRILEQKPETCNNEQCPLLSAAYEAKRRLESIIKKRSSQSSYDVLSKKLSNIKKENEYVKNYHDCKERLKTILLRTNGCSFNKVKFLNFKHEADMVRTMLFDSSSITRFESLCQNSLDTANQISEYKALKNQKMNLEHSIDKLENDQVIIDMLTKDIERLNKTIDEYDVKINELRTKANNLDTVIYIQEDVITKLKSCIEYINKKDTLKSEIDDLIRFVSDNKEKIEKITKYLNVIDEAQKIINDTSAALQPLINKRNSIEYNLTMIDQYNNELAEYQEMFNKIEVLKTHSSPSKGIQLIFIGMYMNKMLDQANEILSKLFGGKFTLLPFIINENEFNIPVAVDGGLNHTDITSMSSAQIALISMIISISLLSQTSTKLNIINGDEIDAPFDGDNRRQFFEILYKLMYLVNANQCVLISHNSELPQDNCDIILLKNDNSDDKNNPPGNIIWSYYDQ